MKATKLSALVYLLWHLAPAAVFGQMPQDRWVFNGLVIPGTNYPFVELCLGPDHNIYAVANNPTYQILDEFTTNGSFVMSDNAVLPSGTTRFIMDAHTNAYAMVQSSTPGTSYLTKFSPNPLQGGRLTAIDSFGFQGTGSNQLNNPTGIAVGPNGYLYVADNGNTRVQIYDTTGFTAAPGGVPENPIQSWTNSPTLDLNNVYSIAPLPDGTFCTSVAPGYLYSPLQVIGPGGSFITNLIISQGFSEFNGPNGRLSVSPDGLVGLLAVAPNYMFVVQPNLGQNPLNAYPSAIAPPFFGQFAGPPAVFDRNGTMYVIVYVTQAFGGALPGSTAIVGMSRIYGSAQTADAPTNVVPAPAPVITSIQQRPGTSLVDIAYNVAAATNQVTTEMVAFQNGTEDFQDLVLMPPSSFTNNGVNNIGANVTANTNHTATWDSSKGITNFASLEFDIMAKDQRPLLNIHFITVPANQTQPALTISSYSYRDSDFFNLWLWLLATNHPSIKLTNGTVVGVGGPYDQQLLAGTNRSTPLGQQFLYQVLNVRPPTLNEIFQTQAGHYGLLYVDQGSLVKLP